MIPPRLSRACGVAALVAAAALAQAGARQQPLPQFAQTIASLSERGGYFDTDNLISASLSLLQR